MKNSMILLIALAWLAVGCDTIHTLPDGSDPSVTESLQENGASSSDLVVINQTIEKLKSHMRELKKLEAKVYAKSAKGDAKKKKEFDRKVKKYGSIPTLQAHLRLLNEVKANIQAARKTKTETASN